MSKAASKLPKKKNKNLIGVAIVLVSVAVVISIKYVKAAVNLSQLKISESKKKGPVNAAIQITEFADFQCPACANGAKFLKKFMEDHPQSVRVEFKYYPLINMHQHAMVASRFAECSSMQGKFWEYTDALFERQDQWKALFDAHPVFESIAKELGLDMAKLEACTRDPKTNEIIEKNLDEGNKSGVKSTPTYFVNYQMVVGSKNLEFELQKLLSAQSNH